MNRQNRKQRIQIVRRFCRDLQDECQRMVCFFLEKDTPQQEICRRMNITRDSLEQLKLQIAGGLRQAGIAFNCEELPCRSN